MAALLKMRGFGCRSAALVLVVSSAKISGRYSQVWRAGIFGRRRAIKSPILAQNRQSETLSLVFCGVFKVRFFSAALLLFSSAAAFFFLLSLPALSRRFVDFDKPSGEGNEMLQTSSHSSGPSDAMESAQRTVDHRQ